MSLYFWHQSGTLTFTARGMLQIIARIILHHLKALWKTFLELRRGGTLQASYTQALDILSQSVNLQQYPLLKRAVLINSSRSGYCEVSLKPSWSVPETETFWKWCSFAKVNTSWPVPAQAKFVLCNDAERQGGLYKWYINSTSSIRYKINPHIWCSAVVYELITTCGAWRLPGTSRTAPRWPDLALWPSI